MTTKQIPGALHAPDGGWFVCLTDGNGNLVTTTKSTSGSKQIPGAAIAPDGSYYAVLADGNGNLI